MRPACRDAGLLPCLSAEYRWTKPRAGRSGEPGQHRRHPVIYFNDGGNRFATEPGADWNPGLDRIDGSSWTKRLPDALVRLLNGTH
jgi:hypothetical protein